MKSQTVKGWVCKTRGPFVFTDTFMRLKRDSIKEYGLNQFCADEKEHGLKCVKATLTTEGTDA